MKVKDVVFSIGGRRAGSAEGGGGGGGGEGRADDDDVIIIAVGRVDGGVAWPSQRAGAAFECTVVVGLREDEERIALGRRVE